MPRFDRLRRKGVQGSSYWRTFALVLTLWSVLSVVGAIRAAGRFAQLGTFTEVEALAAATPYLLGLLALIAAFLVGLRRKGSWAEEPQLVKLGIVVAFVAGVTAWLLVAYSAALSELWTSL